jgi:alpha-1,2-mannosyltransferase
MYVSEKNGIDLQGIINIKKSNFFTKNEKIKIKFLKSDFSGLLPKYYENGTSVIPTTMNDENKEEMDRYVNKKDCDYIIDLNLKYQNEERYIDDPDFVLFKSYKFLDNKLSPMIFRIFYIPFYSDQNIVFGDYYIIKRKNF